MSAFNQPIIKQGAQGEYYEVDGFKYTGTFPYEWATDHKWHTEIEDCVSGPKECGNCRTYGSINGVFVFYCANCESCIYDGVMYPKRNGFIYCADTVTDEELWKACPYMQGIPRSQIGDKVAEVDDGEDYHYYDYNSDEREEFERKLREDDYEDYEDR